MAGLPNVPGVIKVALRFTVGADQNVTTSLHFRYTGGPPSQANLNTIAQSVHDAFGTNLGAYLHTSIALNQVTVQDLADMTKPVGLWAGSTAGTATGTALPASIAAVAKYTIARRYRGGHPRGYWPLGTQNGVADAGHWLASTMTALTGVFNTFITAVKAAGAGITIGNQCSVSYYTQGPAYTLPSGKTRHASTLRTGSIPVDDVTIVSFNTRMGSQRRRLKKA